jgi:transcriptional accessory protein Tex/SPT6
MNNLSNKIRAYLGRTPDFREEVKLQDDGDGVPYIKEWNAKDKAKPTDSQLNALASEATKLNNNNEIRNTRKTAYGDIGEQLDEIYKDIDAWKARVKKIKDDNPKE